MLKENLYYSQELKAFLAGFPEEIIHINYVDTIFDVENYVYISKHSSVAKVRSITAHFPGNVSWNPSHGARARELAYANPYLLKSIYVRMVGFSVEEGLEEEYDVSLEATHHGPTNLSKPILYVEIGSDEEAWRDKRPARIIARSIVEALKLKAHECGEVTLGVGGGHYARKHSKIEAREAYCYSHIFAKYAIEYLDKRVFEEALKKTIGKCKLVMVEKKSVPSKPRKTIIDIVKKLGLEVKYV